MRNSKAKVLLMLAACIFGGGCAYFSRANHNQLPEQTSITASSKNNPLQNNQDSLASRVSVSSSEKDNSYIGKFREPPYNCNVDDYFTPNSPEVALNLGDVKIDTTQYHNVGIIFRNYKKFLNDPNPDRVVYIYAINYMTGLNPETNRVDTIETTTAIYADEFGNGLYAIHHTRDVREQNMVNLDYHTAQTRGRPLTAQEQALTEKAYIAAMEKQ